MPRRGERLADRLAPAADRKPQARFDVHLPRLLLSVSAPGAIPDEARAIAMRHREQLDSFLVSRRAPDAASEDAPRVVMLATEAAARLGVTVQATATGALVQAVGEELESRLGEATVSAGGVTFIAARRPSEFLLDGAGHVYAVRVTPSEHVAAFASGSRPQPLPGATDAVAIVADSCGVVEGAAVAAAEMVRRPGDVVRALEHLRALDGIRGAVIVGGDAVAIFGAIRIEAA